MAIDTDDGLYTITTINKLYNRCWVEFGVLLGCIRAGRFIDWDADIDIGILLEDWDGDIDKLSNNGFKIKKQSFWDYPPTFKYIGKDSIGKHSKLRLHFNNTRICFNIYSGGIDDYRYFSAGNNKRIFKIPNNIIGDITQKPLYNTMINVPAKYEEHLAYVYGNDWRTPNRDYIGSNAHKNNQSKFRIYL